MNRKMEILSGLIITSLMLLPAACGGGGGGGGQPTQTATAHPTQTGQPAQSKIMFLSDRWMELGEREVYVMEADGSDQKNITNDGHQYRDWAPMWSPDGSKIAFCSYRFLEYGIYVMNADGSQQIKIKTVSGENDTPTWSKDGSKIIFP